jgi:hypothetical protein
MRILAAVLLLLSSFSVFMAQERRPATVKKDVDPVSGKAFPLTEIFPPGATVKSERFGGAASNDALQKELELQWTHRASAKAVEAVVYRYAGWQSAYAAFRHVIATELGSAAECADSAKNLWTDADGSRAVFWTHEETAIVRLPEAPLPAGDRKMRLTEATREILSRLDAWHEGLPNAESGTDAPPVVVRKLPTDGCASASVRYAVGRAGLDAAFEAFPTPPGAEFAWADYGAPSPFSRLIIAEYPTPQDATAALDAVTQRAAALPETERASRLVIRRGNFIVQADGVRDPAQASAVAEKIEYDYVVRWLGESPYAEARAAAEAEAIRRHNRNTAEVVISTFRLIGVSAGVMVFLGLAVGGGYFFWRRRQLVGFTERDGMMRLNLNENELPDAASSVKRLHDENRP